MNDPRLVPSELGRWGAEFKRTAEMMKRMRRGTPEQRAEVSTEYAEAACELERLAGAVA